MVRPLGLLTETIRGFRDCDVRAATMRRSMSARGGQGGGGTNRAPLLHDLSALIEKVAARVVGSHPILVKMRARRFCRPSADSSLQVFTLEEGKRRENALS